MIEMNKILGDGYMKYIVPPNKTENYSYCYCNRQCNGHCGNYCKIHRR